MAAYSLLGATGYWRTEYQSQFDWKPRTYPAAPIDLDNEEDSFDDERSGLEHTRKEELKETGTQTPQPYVESEANFENKGVQSEIYESEEERGRINAARQKVVRKERAPSTRASSPAKSSHGGERKPPFFSGAPKKSFNVRVPASEVRSLKVILG